MYEVRVREEMKMQLHADGLSSEQRGQTGLRARGQQICYQAVLLASASQGSVPGAKAVLYKLPASCDH